MMIYAVVSATGTPEWLNEKLGRTRGVTGDPLSGILYGDIMAVVSDLKRPVSAERSVAIEYAGVIDALSKDLTLLPMRFGSVMDSMDAIEQMLHLNYDDFCENLKRVENKSEFGLKVFCDQEELRNSMAEIQRTAGRDVNGPPSEGSGSVYREYVNRKLREHRTEESMMTYLAEVVAEIRACLLKLETVTRFNKPRSEAVIVDAVILIERSGEGELVDVIRKMQKENSGYHYILTGPWPPYNFVEISIK
jgi:hypothetical protein